MYFLTVEPLRNLFTEIVSGVSNLFSPETVPNVKELAWASLERQAEDACLVMACVCLQAHQNRVPIPIEAKRFPDIYVQMGDSQERRAQAFQLFLCLCQKQALVWEFVVKQAGLSPTIGHDLLTLIRETVVIPTTWKAHSLGDLILQVVLVWHATACLMRDAGQLLEAATMRVYGYRAPLLPHHDGSYFVALAESVFAPSVTDLGSWRKLFQAELNRQRRLDRNPSGTGRKREHEVVESDLTAEEEPSPFETIPDPNTPDPAEVVADEDAVDRVLAMATGKTRQLVELLLLGYSVKEAADAVGVTPNTAYVLLHKFRKKLA